MKDKNNEPIHIALLLIMQYNIFKILISDSLERETVIRIKKFHALFLKKVIVMNYQEIMKKYNCNKMTPEAAELFDIAQKYDFRKKRLKEWYLKPLYEIAYKIALFLAKIKSKNALK